MSLRFFIEQIAIAPPKGRAHHARQLLDEMGAALSASGWVHDHVKAEGAVFGNAAKSEANLAFNYGMGEINGHLEFEILEYTDGDNWIENITPCVSHLGMHVGSRGELDYWREFFHNRQIGIAQEVDTTDHSNPVIAGKRWYKYVIFDTRAILGVDIKMILRKERP
jgi:hypothetical protein